MFKLRIALVLFALTAACISPAVAQTAQGTNVGRLSCAMSPSIGLIHRIPAAGVMSFRS